MAQQFTHTPRLPEIPTGHEQQRYFIRHLVRDVMRWGQKDTAQITLESTDGLISHTQYLKANECEELARALLDAAHDLRTHKAAALMAGGRAGAEPVTIISNASLPIQQVAVTTLAAAGAFVKAEEPPTPAIVVIGHASDWRSVLDWYTPALRESPIG